MAERLKAALEKARQQRSIVAHLADTPLKSWPQSAPNGNLDLVPVRSVNTWASIPEISCAPERLSQARITGSSKDDRANASFDALRSKLHRTCAEKAWSRIALAAPTRSCGTTTFALNLAFSFARKTDARVLLVDLHQKAPAIALRLGLTSKISFHSALTQDRPLEDLLHRFGPNLLIAATAAKARSSETQLSDAQFALYLDRLQASYRPDVMLLDLPPVLLDENATPLLKIADAALLIASAEATSAEDLDESARRISAATSYLGAALNKSKDRSARSIQRELV